MNALARNLLDTTHDFAPQPVALPETDRRAEIAAQFIPAGSHVLDLGTAPGLERLLPHGSSYQSAGNFVAEFPTSAAAQSDIIITVVSDDAAMRKIFATSGDSLLLNSTGKLFINCATITPRVHIEVEGLAAKAGARSVEACMASSITQARDGSLYLICGGNEEAFRAAQSILGNLGKTIRYVGEAGEAAKVKALVNMVMNINTAGLAEGLGLGEALGLDLTMLREVFSETGAASRVLQTDGEDMQNREHSCFFSAAHAAKDSGIALDLAREVGLELPLARATKEQYDAMNALLEPLQSFILPGGSPGVAGLHLARTIVRRAERAAVALNEGETINPQLLAYLNRLSDLLFVAARYVAAGEGGDVLWQPGATRDA